MARVTGAQSVNFDRLIASTGALFALAVLAAFGVDAHFSRREALESAEREVQKSAAVLAERVRQMFGAADRALVAAAVAHQAWQRDPGANTASGRRILRALADSSDVIEDIAWFGPDGARQITSAQDRQGRLDASQLDFFNVHTARTDRGLYIGKSFRLVADGPWITPVSRRMDDDSGKFIGVAAAVLDAKYIGSVLERFHAANGAAYAIILESGAFLARVPSPDGRTGESALETSLFRSQLPKAKEGTYRATSVSGGEERYYHYQTVAGHSVIVVASLGEAETLAGWSGRIRITGLLAAIAILGALLATWLIHRQARRLRLERREAQRARQIAEHANRSKSEFLAHMSHELRTPMNAVIGFTEMMSREVFGPVGSPKYREYIGDIAASGQHLLHVVNNILDLAKVEAGKWEMDDGDVNLRDLCESTLQLVRERARSAGVALSCDAAAPEVVLRGDHRLLRQIIVNLLTNGIKFTERGGKVSLGWDRRPDGMLALVVADTGVGMTEEDCRRVMEPFGRGSAELARARHDTGLGLTLCRQFAKMHGGRLELASALGKGTVVSVVLPASRVIHHDSPKAAAA